MRTPSRYLGTISTADRVEFVGTEGALALDYGDPGRAPLSQPHAALATGAHAWKEIEVAEAESTIPGLGVLDPTVRGVDVWLVEAWVRALDEVRDHVVNAEVGANTMEMIHGAFASHAEGRRIDLPQVDRSHALERWLTHEGRSTFLERGRARPYAALPEGEGEQW